MDFLALMTLEDLINSFFDLLKLLLLLHCHFMIVVLEGSDSRLDSIVPWGISILIWGLKCCTLELFFNDLFSGLGFEGLGAVFKVLLSLMFDLFLFLDIL
jgi:hypothetical protein